MTVSPSSKQNADVTQDSLLGGQVSIRQPAQGYRVSVDAVLLAACVPLEERASVLDVGCGHGGATLCLAWRKPQARFHGIDVRPDAVAQFSENVILNAWQDRMTASVADVADGAGPDYAGRFDWVISNPPYLPVERMDRRASDGGIDPATTETVPLRAWVIFMMACLRKGGRVAVVHRADRIEELLAILAEYCGAIEVFPIWPKAGAPAKRVVVTARKGDRSPSKIQSGLVLHDENGDFTPAAHAVLVDGAPLNAG